MRVRRCFCSKFIYFFTATFPYPPVVPVIFSLRWPFHLRGYEPLCSPSPCCGQLALLAPLRCCRSSPSLLHRRKPLSSARAACTAMLLRRCPQLAFVVGTCAVASHHITSLSSARAASESDVSAVRNSRIEEKPQGVDLLD